MGIFSNEAHYGYHGEKPFNEDTLESIMMDDNVEPYEGEDLMEGALDCCITMQENYNMFMTQIALSESSYFERTGELMVYNEGMLGDMVNAIKNFLKKIWEKIKALFKRFMMQIDSWTKTDKEFVQKYKKEIYSGKSLTDFTFKGWKFDQKAFDKTSTAVDACTAYSECFKFNAGSDVETEKELKEAEDKYDDYLDKARGKLINILGGKDGSYDSSEFTKELHAVYRNGEDSKEELDDKDIGSISNIATELMSSKDLKKTLNDAIKAGKKAIDQDTKDVERRQNEFFKNQPLSKDDVNKEYTDKDHGKADFKYREETDDEKRKYYDGKTRMHEDDYIQSHRNNDHKIDAFEMFKRDDSSKQASGLSFKRGSTEIGNPGSRSRIDGAKYEKITGKQSSDRAAKSFNLYLRKVRDCKSCLVQIEGACMNALKERSRQNKAIIIAYVAHKPKNESVAQLAESAKMGYTPFFNVQMK